MTFEEYNSSECSGLVSGFANKKSNNAPVHASAATKSDGPFYCPECFSEAVVKKCTDKVDHFAHVARLSPICLKKDTELHHQCRDEICKELKNRFPQGKWEAERRIPGNKEKGFAELIPDISGFINETRVVIEIQASALSINQIIERTKQYTRRGCAILWILPLREPLGTDIFKPRLFEKYLHSMYFGRCYYWIKGNGTFVHPVHYGKAERWIEESNWFEDGIERSEGGYPKIYKIIKTPMYGADISIANDFVKEERHEFIPENFKKTVPKCLIYKDSLQRWWEQFAT